MCDMAKTKTTKWDAAKHLKTEEDIQDYLAVAFEDGHPDVIKLAIGAAARARGMTSIASQAGVSRESLYQSLSENGNPAFATVIRVMNALGLAFSIKPHPQSKMTTV